MSRWCSQRGGTRISAKSFNHGHLDAAIARWVEVVHTGPFFPIDNARIEDLRYRGGPASAALSLAIGNSGGVQIELIQLRDAMPSRYRELPHGVHHLALLARDFEPESARLARLAHPLARSLTLPRHLSPPRRHGRERGPRLGRS